jgi:pilus assembly protein CpaE
VYPLNTILIGGDEAALPDVRRELMNVSAHLEAEFRRAADAIDALRRTRNEKRLVLYHLESPSALDLLGRMSSLFPGWPVVVLMGRDGPDGSRHDEMITAMRAGASQIISLPLCPRDFKAALDRVAVQYVYSARGSDLIAVAGATGGCGATTLGINLAFEAAHLHGLRCVLVDLSLKMGVIASHLNLRPTASILDLLRDSRRVDALLLQRVLVKVTDNFMVLPGPEGISGAATAAAHDLSHVLDVLRQVADVIVLDVPCTYDDLYFEALSGAAHAVLIGEQKLPSVRALKLVRESLVENPGRRDHVVINRYDPKAKGFTTERLLKPLGVTEVLTVARDDGAMEGAMVGGCVLRLAAPRSQALADISELAGLLLNRQACAPARPAGLFGRLGRAISNT